jgi:hypothetical protein
VNLKQGQIVAITSGEYSSYCLDDHMRAERDFDACAELARFKAEGDYRQLPSRVGEVSIEHAEIYALNGAGTRFLAWMIREGLLSPLPVDEVVELWVDDQAGSVFLDSKDKS